MDRSSDHHLRAVAPTVPGPGVDEMEDIMSAAVAWEVAPLEVRPGRPALHLVSRGSSAVARPAVKVTRFGRLLITASAVAVVTLLALTILGVGAAGASIDHRITVGAGQTLSQVAAAELPQLPVSEGVAQIQLANQLNSSQVHAGQELAIPSPG